MKNPGNRANENFELVVKNVTIKSYKLREPDMVQTSLQRNGTAQNRKRKL